MGMAGRGPLLPRQNHSPRSVLEMSGPYWREMMLAKSTMGHPQDQHRLERETEREKGEQRGGEVEREGESG